MRISAEDILRGVLVGLVIQAIIDRKKKPAPPPALPEGATAVVIPLRPPKK